MATIHMGSPAISEQVHGALTAREARFVENGAGTYTAEFELPPRATLVDIIVTAEALWTAATSASLEIGDDDDADGFFTAVDLKATDLLAGESVSLGSVGTEGGVAGAYATAGTETHITKRYSEAARTITATVVSVGAGTAGRTRVMVVAATPPMTEITQ